MAFFFFFWFLFFLSFNFSADSDKRSGSDSHIICTIPIILCCVKNVVGSMSIVK